MDKCTKWYGTKHNFSKWETTREGNVVSTITKSTLGFWVRQERFCENCGYRQINYKEYY